jgi:methanogenic corrinoid protein MtbC1
LTTLSSVDDATLLNVLSGSLLKGEGTLRPQLLEKRGWQEFGDLPCVEDADPISWNLPIDDASERHPSSLAELIAIDVVPSLVLAHRPSGIALKVRAQAPAEIIEEFAALVLAEETPALMAYVEMLQLEGATIEALYLGLLSATARRLGEYWETDTASFASVTIGLWRLQEVLRNLSSKFQVEGPKPAHGHRALLLSTVGEQHNFGLAMLGEFLFRDGWSVAGGPGLSSSDIEGLLRREFFSLVGLSLSCESRIDQLTSLIRLIRRTSRNRGIFIMVGGALFIERPELVTIVGADSTAPDARLGAIQAERLINNLGRAF